MDRRELLQMISAATGFAMIGGSTLLASRTRGLDQSGPQAAAAPPAGDTALLTEITETILPRTDTPGATDAEVVPFMLKIVEDCYPLADQATFRTGLAAFRDSCREQMGRNFADLAPQQRTAFLTELDREARTFLPQPGGSAHYFTMIKQLTLFAYFTSELVQTHVLRHVAIPGRFNGCHPYRAGEPAWAIQR
jgi:hypothetical protein